MEEAFTKKDFKDNERDNEHGENAKIVVGRYHHIRKNED